jgi:transcriptional regulator with XRE-family HTH domain
MEKRPPAIPDSVPSPIDVHVGARIRQRRVALGMSQEKLGGALNLTFQQIQKYERGANRVGASRLYDLCRVFDVTADYFFEGLPNFDAIEAASLLPRGAAPPAYAFAEHQARLAPERDEMSTDSAELLRHFSRVTDPEVRLRILDLVKSLAAPAR